MRNSLICGLFAIFCLMCSSAADAQWWKDRWEVTPFAGYETSGSFPVGHTLGIDKIKADGNLSFGSFIDYSVTRNAQFEFMWNRNETDFEEHHIATGFYTKAFNSKIDQFHFGMLYMFRGSDAHLRPYVAAGLGFSHEFNTGANPNRTDFSFGVGGGVKYMLGPHFGFRGDARWVPTYASSTRELVCDPFGFCFPANVANYLHRGNFTAGLIFRF